MGSVVISVRDVYGRVRAFPVNDEAKAFAALVGAKTLSAAHLELIQGLGFKIEVESAGLSAMGLQAP